VVDGVLVGHSMAGLSIPGILDRVPERIRHVVFVSCVVPADGTSLVDMMPPDIAEFIRSSVPSPEGVVLSRDELLAQQCYDMDEAQTAFTLDVAVPEAYWPVREPVDLAGLRHPVRRTWVRLTGDRIFPPEVQDEMAARTGCTTVVDIASGHMAMISRPRALADVLNQVLADS
jgi:pimeloyl-ACP methyl ester carboxylesterase